MTLTREAFRFHFFDSASPFLRAFLVLLQFLSSTLPSLPAVPVFYSAFYESAERCFPWSSQNLDLTFTSSVGWVRLLVCRADLSLQ